MENLPSKILQDAVSEFSKFPGIGKKTALRLVLHLLSRSNDYTESFAQALLNLQNIQYCPQCHNVNDTAGLCNICSSHRRDQSLICVVEDIRDIIAIENTGQYNGLYHVLGGIISPMSGIGPNDLHINTLIERVEKGEVKEVIMALSTTMEGDTTVFFLSRKLQPYQIKLSTIARGIAIGDELEYADEITLGRSIINRTPLDNSQSR